MYLFALPDPIDIDVVKSGIAGPAVAKGHNMPSGSIDGERREREKKEKDKRGEDEKREERERERQEGEEKREKINLMYTILMHSSSQSASLYLSSLSSHPVGLQSLLISIT